MTTIRIDNFKALFHEDGVPVRENRRMFEDLTPEEKEEEYYYEGHICNYCGQGSRSNYYVAPSEGKNCDKCINMEGFGWASSWIDFIVFKALNKAERTLFINWLNSQTSEMKALIDWLIFEASTFRGSGYVKGHGLDTGVVDELPAELEPLAKYGGKLFVFTAKATKEIGVSSLYQMMHEAEYKADQRLLEGRELARKAR